jgi:hypothetical protein
MDYIEFKLWKAGLLIFAAFVWGLYCGITGRPLGPVQRDNQIAPDPERLAEK